MNRRMLIAVIATALVLPGCSHTGPPPRQTVTVAVSYDDLLTQKTVTRQASLRVGDALTVSLGANPSTGYQWDSQAQISDGAVLTQTGHRTIAPADGRPAHPDRRSGRSRRWHPAPRPSPPATASPGQVVRSRRGTSPRRSPSVRAASRRRRRNSSPAAIPGRTGRYRSPACAPRPAPILLRRGRTRLTVQRNGIRGEIPDLNIEDLIDDVAVDSAQVGLLQDELTVNHQGEQVTDHSMKSRSRIWSASGAAVVSRFCSARAWSRNRATFGMSENRS